jgi:hypothetical protein
MAHPGLVRRGVERVVEAELQRGVGHDLQQRHAQAAVQAARAVAGQDAARRVTHGGVHPRLALRRQRSAQQVEGVAGHGARGARQRALHVRQRRQRGVGDPQVGGGAAALLQGEELYGRVGDGEQQAGDGAAPEALRRRRRPSG